MDKKVVSPPTKKEKAEFLAQLEYAQFCEIACLDRGNRKEKARNDK